MSKADKEATPLAVMLGTGDQFRVGEHSYRVLPLKLKDVDEFTSDNLSLGAQIFNLLDKKTKKNLDKWLTRQVRTADGQPLTLEKAIEDDWTVEDLRNCLVKLVGVSG